MRSDRRLGALLLVLAVAVALVAGPGTPSTSAAFTARVTNSTNTVTAAPYFTCRAAAVGDNAYLAYSLGDATKVTAADATANARTGTYAGLPVATASATSGCVRDAAASTVFNGTSNQVTTPLTPAVTNPQVFSVEAWFNTTTTTGGKIIGFGNQSSLQSATYDRHVYLTNAGRLVFGVFPGAVRTITSPLSYNDGAWHHVVATLSAAGMVLYVDGAVVATDPATTSAQVYNGFWRIGFDNLGSWTAQPTSSYYAGRLAWVAVYTTALTAAQVRNHHVAGR